MRTTTKRSFTGHLANAADTAVGWPFFLVIMAGAFAAGCAAGAVLAVWDEIDRARGIDHRPEVYPGLIRDYTPSAFAPPGENRAT